MRAKIVKKIYISIFLCVVFLNVAFANEIPVEKICSKDGACRSFDISIETNTKSVNARFLVVRHSCYFDWGSRSCETSYFIEEEPGKYLKTGEHIYSALDNKMFTPDGHNFGIGLSMARHLGWRTNISFPDSSLEYVYKRKFIKQGDVICVVYEMKSPFGGYFKDCGLGRNFVENKISYLPVTTTLSESINIACRSLVDCKPNETHWARIAIAQVDNKTIYKILMERRITSDRDKFVQSPTSMFGHDYQIVEIDPYSGSVIKTTPLPDRPDYENW